MSLQASYFVPQGKKKKDKAQPINKVFGEQTLGSPSRSFKDGKMAIVSPLHDKLRDVQPDLWGRQGEIAWHCQHFVSIDSIDTAYICIPWTMD